MREIKSSESPPLQYRPAFSSRGTSSVTFLKGLSVWTMLTLMYSMTALMHEARCQKAQAICSYNASLDYYRDYSFPGSK